MTKLEENRALLETARTATLGMVCNLSQAEMDRPEGPGKWSAGEVLDHLLRAENLYRGEIGKLVELVKQGKTPYIRRGVQDIDFSPSFLPKQMLPLVDFPLSVMTMFVPPVVRDAMIRSASVLKGQSPGLAMPQKGRPATELVMAMRESLEKTQAVLDANPKMPWDTMKLQHPMLGINSVPQLLRLTALHEQRHQDQLRRILALPAAAA